MNRNSRAVRTALPLLLGSVIVGCSVLAPQPARNDNYEVWLVDQSNTPGLSFGGTVYVYDGADLSASPAAASAIPLAIIDLGGSASGLCMQKTGVNPVRPHMLLFNEAHTHAILAFVASGHVVIFDARSRQPLDCVRTTTINAGNRQAHAAFPSPDGSYILVANQNGKALERIDTDYNTNTFIHRPDATINLATCTTPNGQPCESPTLRPFNAPICPVISRDSRYAFITLRDGGMFVVDAKQTPMTIVAEYDKETVKGNGCGGAQVGQSIYINSGGSAVNVSASGLDHPMLFGFDVYRFPITGYSPSNPPNTPAPVNVYAKSGAADSHGVAVTRDGRHLWVFDRHGDVAEVISTRDHRHVNTVQLAGSVSSNPAPDLVDISPNGDLFFVALRGPTPLTGDPHNATGNTPGLGIVAVDSDGRGGELTSVVRITNVGGDGIERADAHAVRVRLR
jgi:DNA-binding beta-propeller fold protein YncE